MVVINGESYAFAGKTLAECLSALGFDASRVAVERNGEIAPRSRYGETTLVDGDRVEIVRFVGGG